MQVSPSWSMATGPSRRSANSRAPRSARPRSASPRGAWGGWAGVPAEFIRKTVAPVRPASQRSTGPVPPLRAARCMSSTSSARRIRPTAAVSARRSPCISPPRETRKSVRSQSKQVLAGPQQGSLCRPTPEGPLHRANRFLAPPAAAIVFWSSRRADLCGKCDYTQLPRAAWSCRLVQDRSHRSPAQKAGSVRLASGQRGGQPARSPVRIYSALCLQQLGEFMRLRHKLAATVAAAGALLSFGVATGAGVGTASATSFVCDHSSYDKRRRLPAPDHARDRPRVHPEPEPLDP
ncbi:hypothetical protein SAMN05442782_10860 [Streptomyces sp. OK228]|nr:hypothetical protein SAMN05442782_10860 [Streptomyces sp. OK228]